MSNLFGFEETFGEALDDLKLHESDDLLVIGLDFGTTFSGIAYAFANHDKPDVSSITEWPGAEGFTQPKTPTIISYDQSNNKSFKWGAQTSRLDKESKIEGIKLLLDPDIEKPLYVPAANTKAQIQQLGKPPVEVAGDYIEAIYKYAMTKIEKGMAADYLRMCQKKFVVTVPAIWSDKAKDMTLKAVKRAGIYPVTLIKEPEAAALYTLHYHKEKALSVGDAFVLCDAGGGTVDLISYEITKLKPRLELKELVKGTGGMAGSLMLNKRFEEHVRDIVGPDQYAALIKTKGYGHAMDQFDRSVKTAFRSTADEFFINFPMANLKDDPANGLESNCLHLTGEVMHQIFQPLITDIKRLVDDQIKSVVVKRMTDNHPRAKEIKAVFLVGGFGASEYLRKCLQEIDPTIQVIQPFDAWAAIVKGAVLSQLPQEAVITSSVAPAHYGIASRHVYDPLEDKDEPIIIDEFDGQTRVRKMTWYILQGEDLVRDQKIEFPFYRSLPENFSDSELKFKSELTQCDAIRPAPYPKPGLTKVNCILESDLRSVPRTMFKKMIAKDGRPYYDVYYNLIVTIDSAVMRFSLEFNGQEMGKVEAQYT